MLLEWETDSNLLDDPDKNSHLSCEGLSNTRSIKRIVHSGDMGVVLLGSVKVGNLILIHLQFSYNLSLLQIFSMR